MKIDKELYEYIRSDSVKLNVKRIKKGCDEDATNWYYDYVRDNFDKEYSAEDFIDDLIDSGCLNNNLALSLAYKKLFFDYDTDE